MPTKKPAKPKLAKPTRKPASRKKPAAGKPLADPILKARWDAELSRYQRARTEEMAGWDERYEALGAILGAMQDVHRMKASQSFRRFRDRLALL